MALGHQKLDVYRLAAMLGRLGGRGYQVRESEDAYAEGAERVDPDPDSDLRVNGQAELPDLGSSESATCRG